MKRVLLPALGFWPIIWPLSFSSPCHAIHSGYYTDLYVPFSIHLVTECKHVLAFILTWICYFNHKELTYIPYSSFNGQSLRPVNSNMEGYWEIDLPSLLSVADHVTSSSPVVHNVRLTASSVKDLNH